VAVRGDLRFMAWTDPIGFASGLTSGVATHHYEQPGSIAGVLEVGDERIPIAGAGMRDHSWGVRDWQGVPYWRWFGMIAGPDDFLLANNVGTADGGEIAGGHLMRDGELQPVVACTTDAEVDPDLGHLRRFTARITDAAGRETTLEGEAVSVAPLRQRRDGRLTLVNETLTRLRWEGREAIGLSEYLVQSPAEQD
jgi:predicted secreted hydrolase